MWYSPCSRRLNNLRCQRQSRRRRTVTVTHVTFARAVQAQVVPAATDTEPVVAAAPTEVATLESAGAHGAEDAKVLEVWLAELPPGPTAETRAS